MLVDQRPAIEYTEGQRLLFEGSLRAVFFNAVMATMLAVDLFYYQAPTEILGVWLAGIFIITIIRTLHCKLVVSTELFKNAFKLNLKIFLILACFAGLIWTSIYFVLIIHATKLQQYITILVFGGMSAGAVGTLSVYIPAFAAYVLSIFGPVILYNYALMDLHSSILATMIVLYLLALTIIVRTQQGLLKSIFYLTEQNQILREKFEHLSLTDPLTGLFNRRHFNKNLKEEYNRAKRNQQSFSLISIDVDNFKLINDSFGHPFGDQFLIYMAGYLKNYLRRANDIIFRLGGDEFAALLLNSTEANTKIICEELKTKFLKIPSFDYEPKDSDHQRILAQVSLSMGIVFVPYESKSKIEQILEKVDKSLYDSKHEGKNQIRYTSCE